MEPWVWAVLLLIAGGGLAILEVFFPSAGILGFLSATAFVTGIIMGFQQGVWVGVSCIAAVGIGTPTLVVLAFKYWPYTPMGRRMLLSAPSRDEVMPEDDEKDYLKSLVGRTGRAKSKLLLSGVVTIDGQTVDAVSESMPVEAGQPVRVIRAYANRVVVRPIDEEELATPPTDPLQETYEDPFEPPET